MSQRLSQLGKLLEGLYAYSSHLLARRKSLWSLRAESWKQPKYKLLYVSDMLVDQTY